MRSFSYALFATFVFSLVACEPLPPELCTPGAKLACAGTDGCSGAQLCDDDGLTLSECRCEDGVDMDARVDERADSGMEAMDAGELASSMDGAASMDSGAQDDASLDAGGDAAAQSDAEIDAGPGADFGPFDCNPITNVPCAEDQRCAWVAEAEDPGTRCIEDGELAEGTTCENPAVGEADDCERGTTCIGSCESICSIGAADSCEPNEHCIGLRGRFTPEGGAALAGACLAECDPVTQLTTEDEPCGENKGCFVVMDDATATCARASLLTQDQPIEGEAFNNSCASGFTPISNAAGVMVCTAYCDPAENFSGSSDNLGGEGPHTCAARGASASHECRFAWAFSAYVGNDPRINEIGLCIDPTGRVYDGAGDAGSDTPWPSCADLPNSDTDGDGVAEHASWGCAPMAL